MKLENKQKPRIPYAVKLYLLIGIIGFLIGFAAQTIMIYFTQ